MVSNNQGLIKVRIPPEPIIKSPRAISWSTSYHFSARLHHLPMGGKNSLGTGLRTAVRHHLPSWSRNYARTVTPPLRNRQKQSP